MSFSADRLYELLPMIYRLKDGDQGKPLKALLGVIGEQIAGLEENLEQLYDDQFIETCADWVVPYIGGLLGYEPVYAIKRLLANQRAEVANTIGYRRRKGTAAMLEQLAHDVTDWPTRAVEFFQHLQWHQHMNHIRPQHYGVPVLRDTLQLEYLTTAFDSANRTVDVRRIETDGGRFNIPNIGLFVWRLQVYGVERSIAPGLDDRRFFFSPWANNMQLYNRPEAEVAMAHLAEPIETPMPMSRLLLQKHKAQNQLDRYYGSDKSLFVRVNNGDVLVSDIHICSLEDSSATTWEHVPDSGVALDPQLGRLALGDSYGANPLVEVAYHYTFSEDMGGGDYERAASFVEDLSPNVTVHTGQTLQSGINALPGHGVVEITDNSRYEEAPSVTVAASEALEIRAMNEARPVCFLTGDFTVDGAADGVAILNGLWIGNGRVHVPPGSALKRLVIRHCTLVPGLALKADGEPQFSTSPSIVVESETTELIIEQSIVGAIRVHQNSACSIRDSIVDATDETHTAYAHVDDNAGGGVLAVTNSTMIGKVHAQRFELVSNSILEAALAPVDSWQTAVMAVQKQQGCVRFSYVPLGSRTPRRYRCQPEIAVLQAIAAAEKTNPLLSAADKSAIADFVAARIHPVWQARRYGKPAYMQLAQACAKEIVTGAEDEAEMGVFHDLYQPQRLANLRIRLQEYLRFGLEAGVIFMS
jgi:hypothetical protein